MGVGGHHFGGYQARLQAVFQPLPSVRRDGGPAPARRAPGGPVARHVHEVPSAGCVGADAQQLPAGRGHVRCRRDVRDGDRVGDLVDAQGARHETVEGSAPAGHPGLHPVDGSRCLRRHGHRAPLDVGDLRRDRTHHVVPGHRQRSVGRIPANARTGARARSGTTDAPFRGAGVLAPYAQAGPGERNLRTLQIVLRPGDASLHADHSVHLLDAVDED